MSAGATVAIIVVILLVIAIAAIGSRAAKRRRLRERFGPEYDRAVAEQQSRRKAESELASRERRVRQLDIRPLTPAARTEYTAQWTTIQERFVDEPVAAVTQAQQLVTAVMDDRGYLTEGYDQMVADLSVDHARTLEHYREAHAISESAQRNSASTESLRLAMVHYRAMFDDLLSDVSGEPAAVPPAQGGAPSDSPAEPAAAAAPGAQGDAATPNGSDTESPGKRAADARR